MLSARTCGIWLASLLLLLTSRTEAQQHRVRLITDQPLTLHGKLEVKFRGFFSYLVIDTGDTYLADGGADEGTKTVRLIELDCNGRFAELAKYAGRRVTARGKLFIEFAAPVPFNGVQLEHATVQLPNGKVIMPHPPDAAYTPPKVPPNVLRYMFTRTIIPFSAIDPPDVMVDLDSGQKLIAANPGYCVMGGAQDYMTCACGKGFSPLRGGLVRHPFSAREWRSIPKPEDHWQEMRAAQFALPEDARRPLHIQLVCQRDQAVTR